MPNVDGLGGYNKSDGTIKLIASYGNDLVDVISGVGYKQNITSGLLPSFEQFLDQLFFNNRVDRPRHFDGTTWRQDLANKMIPGKYMKRWRGQLYIAYGKIPDAGNDLWDKDPVTSTIASKDIVFPTRVFFPNVSPRKDQLQWGLYWSQRWYTKSANDNKIFVDTNVSGVGFKDVGLKVGDPLYLLRTTSGTADLYPGKYTITRIDSNNQLTLLEKVPVQVTNVSGWAGSNWFDVDTEDGDFITGIEENNDRLLVFENDSLYRYDKNSLKKVKGVPGSTAPRSIKNVKDGVTIYFHGSIGDKTGFYLHDGVNSRNISRPFEKHMKGIQPTFYDDVVAWVEGDLYRAYIGTLTNPNFGISLSNVVWTYDAATDTQSIDPIGKAITSASQIRQTNKLNTYIGDSDASVFLTGLQTVFSYDGSPIPFVVECWPKYPVGTEVVVDFTRIQVIARNARGMKVQYKLYNKPNQVDDNWQTLGDITDDLTEFTVPVDKRQARGMAIRFADSTTKEPDLLIEKISFFYRPIGAEIANLS